MDALDLAPADFRSDTVTRPTAAMRQAMAEAAVGDDVFGDDPTVNRLEAEGAALFGKEAALFVPTGTQGNQIAVHLHTRPGQEVVVGDTSHTFDWELGGLSSLSGVQARPVPTVRGAMDADAVAALLDGAHGFRPACRLVCVENTHNFHGGSVVPLAHLQHLRDVARERGATVHLDGARIWNAAVAAGVSLADYGATADTLMACLSKGLGAPVGSLLVGSQAFIDEARIVRKRWGGGMRQVGVLAAPARLAIDGREALAEDHRRALALAEGFLACEGVTLPYDRPDTNIVFVRVPRPIGPAVQAHLATRGVLAIATEADVLRFVTHKDVDDTAVARAVEAFSEAVAPTAA